MSGLKISQLTTPALTSDQAIFAGDILPIAGIRTGDIIPETYQLPGAAFINSLGTKGVGTSLVATKVYDTTSGNTLNIKSLSALSPLIINDDGNTITINLSSSPKDSIAGIITPINCPITNVNGFTQSFALPNIALPTDPLSYRVDINGVLQRPGIDYSIITGSPYNIFFSTTPFAGEQITVIAFAPFTSSSFVSGVSSSSGGPVTLDPNSIFANPTNYSLPGISLSVPDNSVVCNPTGTVGLSTLTLGDNQVFCNPGGGIGLEGLYIDNNQFLGNFGNGLQAVTLSAGTNITLNVSTSGVTINSNQIIPPPTASSLSSILSAGNGISLTSSASAITINNIAQLTTSSLSSILSAGNGISLTSSASAITINSSLSAGNGLTLTNNLLSLTNTAFTSSVNVTKNTTITPDYNNTLVVITTSSSVTLTVSPTATYAPGHRTNVIQLSGPAVFDSTKINNLYGYYQTKSTYATAVLQYTGTNWVVEGDLTFTGSGMTAVSSANAWYEIAMPTGDTTTWTDFTVDQSTGSMVLVAGGTTTNKILFRSATNQGALSDPNAWAVRTLPVSAQWFKALKVSGNAWHLLAKGLSASYYTSDITNSSPTWVKNVLITPLTGSTVAATFPSISEVVVYDAPAVYGTHIYFQTINYNDNPTGTWELTIPVPGIWGGTYIPTNTVFNDFAYCGTTNAAWAASTSLGKVYLGGISDGSSGFDVGISQSCILSPIRSVDIGSRSYTTNNFLYCLSVQTLYGVYRVGSFGNDLFSSRTVSTLPFAATWGGFDCSSSGGTILAAAYNTGTQASKPYVVSTNSGSSWTTNYINVAGPSSSEITKVKYSYGLAPGFYAFRNTYGNNTYSPLLYTPLTGT